MLKNEKQTTKYCPQCGNDMLVLCRTLNAKYCVDCKVDGKIIEIPWYLDEGQVAIGYLDQKKNR